MNSISITSQLYKTIDQLCDPKRKWKRETISFSRVDKWIDDNLDHFFYPSNEYGMKRKFEILLNFSERIKIEFDNKIGKILAFSIQGIANEVLNEGSHTEPSLPPEIIELILFSMLQNNLDNLENIYPKNSDLIWRKFKHNVDNAFLKIIECYSYNLQFFGFIKPLEAVDFIIEHQLSNAVLKYSDMNVKLLKKLALHCPHLQGLKLLFFDPIGRKVAGVIGNMSSLKSLDIASYYNLPGMALALEKLTLLNELRLDLRVGFSQIGFGKMTSLNSLELDSIDKIPDLSWALENLTQLKKLRLNDKAFSGIEVNVIGKMTNLTSLSLESSHSVAERKLTPILEKLTSLTKLSLMDEICQELEVISLIGKMTSLVLLDLHNNKNIPEINLLAAIQKLTLLEYLNLQGTTISSENLILAIENKVALKRLAFTNYDLIDEGKLKLFINVLKKLPSLGYLLTGSKMIEALKPDLKNIYFIDCH